MALLPDQSSNRFSKNAACVLGHLANNTTHQRAVLEAVASAALPWHQLPSLHEQILMAAQSRLDAAEAGDDTHALECAIQHATAAALPSVTIQRAHERLTVIKAAQQERRKTHGLCGLDLPDEFVCPITFEKMIDPVVASDGNSYERSALWMCCADPTHVAH